jgi:hypothetical protein
MNWTKIAHVSESDDGGAVYANDITHSSITPQASSLKRVSLNENERKNNINFYQV